MVGKVDSFTAHDTSKHCNVLLSSIHGKGLEFWVILIDEEIKCLWRGTDLQWHKIFKHMGYINRLLIESDQLYWKW